MKSSPIKALLFALALTTGLVAQPAPCNIFGDDGLGVGCCVPVPQVNFPAFPVVTTSTDYGCLLNCALEANFPGRVRFTFSQFLCDYATINVLATPNTGTAPGLSGTLYAKYSRTWIESDPASATRTQVWRFLVNGDMRYMPPQVILNSACPVPPEGLAGRPVHFAGTIDYRCEPSLTGGFRVRFDLSHLPGCISHAPWSERPLAGPAAHNSRSYHLVGPAPFSWVVPAAPTGTLISESVRASRINWAPFAYNCLGEHQVTQGSLTTAASSCLTCNPLVGATTTRYRDQVLNVGVQCSGTVAAVAGLPIPGVAPTGLKAIALGRYADGTELHTYWGVLTYTDPCTADGPFHVVHGSATKHNGRQLFPWGPIAFGMNDVALDLGNALPLNSFPPTIGWGSPHVSTVVFQFFL